MAPVDGCRPGPGRLVHWNGRLLKGPIATGPRHAARSSCSLAVCDAARREAAGHAGEAAGAARKDRSMGESTGRLASTGRDGSAGVLVKALSQQVSGPLRDEMQPGCPGHLASLLVQPSPAAQPGLWAVSWCRPAVLRQLRQGHRPRGWRPGQGRSAAALQGRPACRRPARRERCRGPGRRGAALRKLPQADRVRAR